AQDDHWPDRPFREAFGPCITLNVPDPLITAVDCHRQLLMDIRRIIPGNQHRRVTVAAKQADQFVFGDARVDGRTGYLVSIEMQNWQHCAVAHRVEKFVALPTTLKRTGFRLSISDDARN